MTKFKLVTQQLLDELITHLSDADTIYLLVSFVMDSGVRLLAPHLQAAAVRGADIKILTGDYLYVTQPEGIASLVSIHPRIEARLWRSHGVSFHPKAYLMQRPGGGSVLIVGSSNLSRSALGYGVEWNLAVNSDAPLQAFHEAQTLFMKMFYDETTLALNSESVKQYEAAYQAYHQRHPNLVHNWTLAEEVETMFATSDDVPVLRDGKPEYQAAIAPRAAQIEALQQLENTRAEGYERALVVMATGLGKTFLAAMFAKGYRRVLFIAHREEILFQAKRAFTAVLPERSCGVYYGQVKEGQADAVFASIFTLGMLHHRSRFSPRAFDLVIIDEFHHAAAKSYQDVIAYFQPNFLLGITATPDRADGRDVYAICDGNVAYKVDFLEAISRGWLTPFRYIGVYDETDYSHIRWLGSRYDEKELLAAQLQESLAAHIYEAWVSHRQTRTLAFCSSIAQANFLFEYFRAHGVRAVSLHSRALGTSRGDAISQLSAGELDVIFTVDLFNEGVDIPAVDTLLFVRPTESLTIFTQQMGRGLRLHEGKTECTIIDLIGNYRNADTKLRLFDVAQTGGAGTVAGGQFGTSNVIPVVPETCSIHLDTRVIDLLEELRKKRQPRKEALRASYLEVKRDLGRRPTYEELHLYGTADSRGYKQEFASWPGFLAWAGELDQGELIRLERYAPWFRELEATLMSKAYKMVVLLAMLERGSTAWHTPITPVQAAPFFHAYYVAKKFRMDADWNDKETKPLHTYDETKVARLIARMPMTMWGGSSKGLVSFDGTAFATRLEVNFEDQGWLYEYTRQICLYRLHVYFERKGKQPSDAMVRGNKAGKDFTPFRVQ